MSDLLARYTAAELRTLAELEPETVDSLLALELRRIESEAVEHADGEDGWRLWLPAMFPDHCRAPFAEHQADFWRWVWLIEPGLHPEAFVAVWNRGGAKSTSAELATVALGCRRRRSYALYVCGTQDQADDHVASIAALLEGATVERHYPEMADRQIGKFGNPRGWRRNRLRTASGFTVDAAGLDRSIRGLKDQAQRPDIVILDDVDDEADSIKTVRKKIARITTAIIPAGSPDLAVLGVQNLIHRGSIFARLVDGRAQFLQRRQVSGPVPALRDAKFERSEGRDVIKSGEATWAGLSVEACQQMLDDMGLEAFLREAQHDVSIGHETLWSVPQLDRLRRPYPFEILPPERTRLHEEQVDAIVDACVGVDPSGGDSSSSNEQGIVIAGVGVDGHGYVLADRSCKLPPEKWGTRAVQAALDFDAEIIVEVNYGGDMAIATIRAAARSNGISGVVVDGKTNKRLSSWRGDGEPSGSIRIVKITASRGKRQRAEPVAALYGDPQDPETWGEGMVHHVDDVDLTLLEDEMTAWNPSSGESPNRLDALVWALTRLMVDSGRRRGARFRDNEG